MTRKEINELLACPNCKVKIPAKTWTKRGGQISAAQRKNPSGPPRQKYDCEWCGRTCLGKVDLKAHMAKCNKKPIK